MTVTVEDNDLAPVTGVMLTPGDGTLVVNWTQVPNATGYEVQWKSGGQGYNTSDRQATVASGSTTSHTIPSLANGTEYTVRVRATWTGTSGPYSDEEMGTPRAAGVTVSETALTVTEADTTGGSYTVVLDSQPAADVVVTVAGHSGLGRDPGPDPPDLHVDKLGDGADGDGDRRQRRGHHQRYGLADPQRGEHRRRLQRHHDRRRDGDGGRQRLGTGDGGDAHAGRRHTGG